MIAIKDIAKIRKDVMDEFVAQWSLSEERWKISSERVRKLNRLAEMLEQLELLDYLLDLRLSLSQIAFLNDMSKKELKEAILFDGNGIGLDPEDLNDRKRVRRHLDRVMGFVPWDSSRLGKDSIDFLFREVLSTAPTRILELSDT